MPGQVLPWVEWKDGVKCKVHRCFAYNFWIGVRVAYTPLSSCYTHATKKSIQLLKRNFKSLKFFDAHCGIVVECVYSIVRSPK